MPGSESRLCCFQLVTLGCFNLAKGHLSHLFTAASNNLTDGLLQKLSKLCTVVGSQGSTHLGQDPLDGRDDRGRSEASLTGDWTGLFL